MLVEPISCISSTQDNMCTLVSCTDSTLKLMDRQKGELLNEYDICFRFYLFLATFSHDIISMYFNLCLTGTQVIQSVIILLKTVYFITIA